MQAPPWHHLRTDAPPDLLPELDSAASGPLAAPASPSRPPARAAAAGEEFASLLPANTLVFGIRGQQAREGDAPSYYNAIEASTVADLLESLIASTAGTHAASADECGGSCGGRVCWSPTGQHCVRSSRQWVQHA